MYIAQKRLKVGHDDETDSPVTREIGEPVPEAETWPWYTRQRYLAEGYLSPALPTTDSQPAPASTRRAPKRIANA